MIGWLWMIPASGVTLNVALYVADTARWWNAASAAFCFCILIWMVAMEARS